VKGAIQFKITNAGGGNVVVNGLFIDDSKDDNINWAILSAPLNDSFTRRLFPVILL